MPTELTNRIRIVTFAFFIMVVAHASATASQLILTWDDNSTNETGFSVERSTGATGVFEEVGGTGPDVTTYVDVAVADATTYCYRVRAFNATEYSDYSNTACATTPQVFGLAVAKIGAGSGTVISTPDGIICGSSCSGTFPSGTSVILNATPANGSIFTGWSGENCAGTGPCTVTITSATALTAAFDMAPVSLTVSNAGTGSGAVSSTPAGISCGTACSASYPYGATVSLTAVAQAGSIFSGWNGSCAGAGSCSVALTSAAAVTATFTQELASSTLSVSVSGKGTVTSVPGGINCASTCSAIYAAGTSVTLTATPGSRFAFQEWGGACSGTGTCTVSMSARETVTATFKKAH